MGIFHTITCMNSMLLYVCCSCVRPEQLYSCWASFSSLSLCAAAAAFVCLNLNVRVFMLGVCSFAQYSRRTRNRNDAIDTDASFAILQLTHQPTDQHTSIWESAFCNMQRRINFTVSFTLSNKHKYTRDQGLHGSRCNYAFADVLR